MPTEQPAWKEMLEEIRFRMRGGPERVFRWVNDRLNDEKADHEFGIVSSQRRTADDLGIVSKEGSNYQAISYDDLKVLLEELKLGPSDSLVDYGSGMGRVVCFAATYPLNRVIGIELSSELCVIARSNLTRIADRVRCGSAEILETDATNFEVPSDLTLFYFFNPFRGSILAKVLDRIGESIRRTPRTARLVFCGTVSSMSFEQEARRYPWLIPTRTWRLPTGVAVLLYECRWPQ